MTSVSITQHKDGRAYVEVDGKRLELVLSLTLTLAGGQRYPVVEIVQHDGTIAGDYLREFSRTFVPTELTLRTV